MNRYDGIDKRIVLNVKRYAKTLKHHSSLRSVDLADIEQELMCEILECLNNFNEKHGNFEHFIRKVLSRRGSNLLKSHMRKKRDSFINFSEYDDKVYHETSASRSIIEHIELLQLIEKMPFKYRLLCHLFANHSIVEIAKILNISRAAVSRDINHIVFMYQCLKNSENMVQFFLRRKFKMKNLAIIEEKSTKELSELPVYDLADLSDQLTKLVSHTKDLKEKFDDALILRFSEIVKEKLQCENKDTGSTKFIENGLQIIAEVPKKVIWDSEKLNEIIKTISDDKRKAIIKTKHVIEERKYSQLTPDDKNLFASARTVVPGKIKFQFEIEEI